MPMRRDVVVVGAGPAGCAAAVQCVRLGLATSLIDRSGRVGGLIANAFVIENYPGLERPLDGQEFARRLRGHVTRFGLDVGRDAIATLSKHPDGWAIQGTQTEHIATNVIVATGTRPVMLGIEGEDALLGSRVFTEVRHLLSARGAGGEVVVVGGGEAALDSSLSLAAAGARVTVLLRSSSPRARGRLPQRVSETTAVTLLPETQLIGLEPVSGGLSLRLKTPVGPTSTEVRAVLVCIGRRKTDFVGGLTPGPGLFICGDARVGSLGQAGIAVGDGLAAASAAAVRSGTRLR